jgi:hypothetical protein
MLVANASHSRPDAASSLVVGLGIICNLAGYLMTHVDAWGRQDRGSAQVGSPVLAREAFTSDSEVHHK